MIDKIAVKKRVCGSGALQQKLQNRSCEIRHLHSKNTSDICKMKKRECLCCKSQVLHGRKNMTFEIRKRFDRIYY